MMIMERVHSFFASDPVQAAMAGAAGGLLRWITLKESWKEGTATLVAGALCARFLGPEMTPAVAPWLGASEDAVGLVSFLVGIGGVSISATIIGIFKNRTLAQAAVDALIHAVTKGRGAK